MTFKMNAMTISKRSVFFMKTFLPGLTRVSFEQTHLIAAEEAWETKKNIW